MGHAPAHLDDQAAEVGQAPLVWEQRCCLSCGLIKRNSLVQVEVFQHW
jgi:hypothetical protein